MDPRCCVKEKAERSGAAATLCRMDLYVVGLRANLHGEDTRCRSSCIFATVKKIKKLLISSIDLWKRLTLRGLRPRFPRVHALCFLRIVQ